MQTFELVKKELDLKQFKSRSAIEKDFTTLIREDTLITHEGEPVILYKKLETDTAKVRAACRALKFTSSTRTRGLKTTSAIFGYNPRNPIRKNYCTATRMAYTQPVEHEVICNFGKELSQMYATFFPKIYSNHYELVKERILPEWQIQDSPFTSGIVNKNNPLKYHFDAGNIKDVLSNMVVFKSGIRGGYLSCPEFDIGLEAADNTVVLFNGQNILHGVTPITALSEHSYRYSIVYYTLEQLWNCLPVDEEIIRARKMHLNRERKRANGLVTKEDLQWDEDFKQ